MKSARAVAWVTCVPLVASLLSAACSSDKRDQGDAGTDTDTDTDSDTDTDGDSDSDEWCPDLSTSCGEPTALESCGDDTLNAPRLIAPLSGKYVRDRRPEIIWDGASSGVSQYRVEIARDRAFTEVVYRSTTYEGYPGIANRFRHIVACDLDCGVHFFRVLSVTSSECEVGVSTYTWEMYVGMAPYDLDRDGVPDIMCWRVEEAGGEFEKDKIQGYAIFDLDEKGGQTLTLDDLVKVVEWEEDPPEDGIGITAGCFGDVDGDAFFDCGISVGLDNGDIVTAHTYVFSKLGTNEVQGKEDAVFDVGGPSPENNCVSFPSNPYWASFSFGDLNGDGFSDLLLISCIDETPDTYVFYGKSSGFVGNTDAADATVISSDIGMWWYTYSTIDLNGDGYSDLLIEAESGSVTPYSLITRFGGLELSGDVDILEMSATINDKIDPIVWGDWQIESPFANGGVQIVGDIDFDGYPELELGVDAFDTSQTCEETGGPIDTGGSIILENLTTPMEVEYSEVVDITFLGDFTVGATGDSTGHLGGVVPSGDLNNDGIVDIVFQSYDDFIEMNRRTLIFNGKTSWDDFNNASAADIVQGPYPNDYITHWYLSDIDGDGIPEKRLYSSVTCSYGSPIQLSLTGEEICISGDFVYYCHYGQGLLIPMQLM